MSSEIESRKIFREDDTVYTSIGADNPPTAAPEGLRETSLQKYGRHAITCKGALDPVGVVDCDCGFFQALLEEFRNTRAQGPSEALDKLPDRIQIEALKAHLVLAVATAQNLEIWALNNPVAGAGHTRPTIPVMDSYPQDIQDRVERQRHAWEHGGEVNEKDQTK